MAYDEFGLLHENAEEWGLPFEAPAVRRESVELAPGRQLSALVWGAEPPELVLLHGGGQNAHTWDTVALALGRPLVAVDLPGHGHSDAIVDVPFSPIAFAAEVEIAVRALAPGALAVVGMSLGGLTSIALSGRAPDLVRKLVLVDVLPSVDANKAAPIAEFLNGPESFASFDEILERTIRYNPTRSEASLRRGVLHNSIERADGTWVWRHQRHWPAGDDTLRAAGAEELIANTAARYDALWADLAGLRVPIMLVRGLADGTIIDDDAVVHLLDVQDNARVEGVEGAGHSVQGDQPIRLAQLVADFL